MNILLLGAQGQLGQTFLTDGGLAARGELTAASRNGRLASGAQGVAIDLTDPRSIESALDAVRPQIIVNAAAYTAVDKAESDEATAQRVNGDAPGALGAWAKRNDALVVHYSTDYVFPGDASAPYAPDAATGPKGAYGRSKLAGETALRDSGAAHLILRTAWVYASIGHNFLKTMLRLGAERDELRVVADQRGTPTPTSVIVAGTLVALDRLMQSPQGTATVRTTHHLTASGDTTWHGFAEGIFNQAVAAGLLARRPLVQAIGSSEFPTPAQRPAYSVLDNRSFAAAFGFQAPVWQAALHDTVDLLARMPA